MNEKEAVLYIKEGCPYCERLAEDLKSKGVAYREVDVSNNNEALQEIKRKYGATRVPVFVDGQGVIIGYKGGG